jgi:hypothetical protein
VCQIREEIVMKKIWCLCLISVIALSFCVAFALYGQEKKETDEVYTIKQGDTLWDISSRFLKNPYLWPKLWQRNPYITNPHWIYPGNSVRLNPPEAPKREEPKKVAMEPKPAEARPAETKPIEPKPIEVATEPEVKKVEPPPIIMKTEVVIEKKTPEMKPVFPEIRFAGFFSDIDFRGIGDVLDSREGKTLMAWGDICYVGFRIKDPISIGEKFTTFSSFNDNIMMDTRYGKRYNITGIIQIIDQNGDFYTARVLESFQEINKGDRIMPYSKEKMEVGVSNK